MTRRSRQITLAATAGLLLAFLAVFLAMPSLRKADERPEGVEDLARYLTRHPADWLAASILTDRALDVASPRRLDLWRNAYAHGRYLAPYRQNPTAAFVRGGLFHWYELGPADRTEVLRAAAPLLGSEKVFLAMHKPLWDLTHDLAYLRRNAPRSEPTLIAMRDLAATNGLFDDYRELRGELTRERLQTFGKDGSTVPPDLLIRRLPNPITLDDEPLARRVLAELERRPLDVPGVRAVPERAADLAEFAIRHGLGPLQGLDAMLETHEIHPGSRLLLARALGREQAVRSLTSQVALAAPVSGWRGTCAPAEVCYWATTTIAADEEIALSVSVVQSDEIPPYVEVYVDDERLAEGPVKGSQRYVLPVRKKGSHQVLVRIANPLTRNAVQRRIRLS